MNFTRPFPEPIAGTPSRNQVLRLLRLEIAQELDAVNLYQTHLEAIADPRVRAVLAALRDDEKEHVARLMTLLGLLDQKQLQEMGAAWQGMEGKKAPLLSYPSVEEMIVDIDAKLAEMDRLLGAGQ